MPLAQLNERAEETDDVDEIRAFAKELDGVLEQTAADVSAAFDSKNTPRAKVRLLLLLLRGFWGCGAGPAGSPSRPQELLTRMRYYRSVRQAVWEKQDSL